MQNERKLSKAVEKRAKDLSDAEFKKRYGKDWKSVKIATAQKQVNEVDMGTVEPIVSVILMILGPLGIKLGFDQLIKLSEKYLEPLIDKFYGKVGLAAKFLIKHAKELREAGKEGYDKFENKLADLISGLHEEDINEISRTKKGKKVPQKYLKGLKSKGKYGSKEAMKREIDRFAGKDEYKQKWDADYTNSGKRIKTKQSAATKAYQKRFGESIESLMRIDENSDTALKNKAKKSGIPLSILRAVFRKGKAAWNTGHRPGTSQNQWAMGRVNSFITGSGGARKADAKLWARAKKARGKTNEIKLSQLLEEVIQDILKQ